jgi:hypothetical protein
MIQFRGGLNVGCHSLSYERGCRRTEDIRHDLCQSCCQRGRCRASRAAHAPSGTSPHVYGRILLPSDLCSGTKTWRTKQTIEASDASRAFVSSIEFAGSLPMYFARPPLPPQSRAGSECVGYPSRGCLSAPASQLCGPHNNPILLRRVAHDPVVLSGILLRAPTRTSSLPPDSCLVRDLSWWRHDSPRQLSHRFRPGRSTRGIEGAERVQIL